MAERWRARLGRTLGHELSGRQPLVLYASHPDFEQTNTIQGELGEGTGGVTESLRRRIVLPLGGPLADTDHVIGHELVHAFQFDMTTEPERGARAERRAAAAALVHRGDGRVSLARPGRSEYGDVAARRRAAARRGRPKAKKGRVDGLPTIKELDNRKYFPYRWGQAFWAYVGGRFGDDVIAADAVDGGGGAATPTWRSNGARAQGQGAVRRLARRDPQRLSAGARGQRCRQARSAAR